MSPLPRSLQAVRASITDRLNRYATDHGQNIALVRRRFVIARFLTRVFDADPDGWILKGGIGMMVRLPQARYSKDIDLLAATDLSDSVDELRRAVRDHHLDHFRFEVGPATELSHDKGVTVTVTASLGSKKYDGFSLDVVGSRRTLVVGRRLPVAPREGEPRENRHLCSKLLRNWTEGAGSRKRRSTRSGRPTGGWSAALPLAGS
ncbi:nucleotidyl transferase AbiEii/AbiGii toxin family protein [Rhodococcus sp. NPDC057014]|uniref:nucleotidyl transferase AbiEii/AbiGii toxin family protein n=1 Tax=Rhodococcus sp. NPDC057014 TaxID=3346000 RepID=UPI00362653C6